MPLYLRGDSGFASPYLYDACEENNCKYAISLKQNSTLIKYAADADDALYRATRENQIDYAVKYGEFEHQAGSWTHPREASSRLRSPITRWYICIPLSSRQWRRNRIRLFSFIAATAKWKTSSRKENPDLIFLL